MSSILNIIPDVLGALQWLLFHQKGKIASSFEFLAHRAIASTAWSGHSPYSWSIFSLTFPLSLNVQDYYHKTIPILILLYSPTQNQQQKKSLNLSFSSSCDSLVTDIEITADSNRKIFPVHWFKRENYLNRRHPHSRRNLEWGHHRHSQENSWRGRVSKKSSPTTRFLGYFTFKSNKYW